MVTAEQVRKLLDYDPKTGLFTYRVSPHGRIQVGQIAGCLNNSGHRKIMICRRVYYAHRLAWLLSYGRWPEGEIDHKNGNPDDNRLVNLREVTHAQNMANSKMPSNNKSGIKGVTWHSRDQCWQANIRTKNRQIYLGTFKTREAAGAAYEAAARKYHGQFKRGAS